MPTDNNIWRLAEAYVSKKLGEVELTELKERLANDVAFASTFYECVNMIKALEASGKQKRFSVLLKDVSKKHKSKGTTRTTIKTISLRSHYLRTGAIAACIALITTLTSFWLVKNNNKHIASQYSLLKRDLEKYKRSQNQIISNIKGKTAGPSAQAKYSGTGFALSNDGYLVTNYHVTEGADSIYIQHNDGQYYKAHIVSFDQSSDIALLKVEDDNFRFSKSNVPYTFATTKKGLGAQIFSLGFPQDEIVYNEGYISANNGYGGDSSQYRLEIPANHGQSGAPVMDANGNVVGIITGKESNTEGTTYAVCTSSLITLLDGLPDASKISLPKSNRLSRLSREKQIERIQQYTCSIKVYKQ